MGGLRNTKPHLTHLLQLTNGTGIPAAMSQEQSQAKQRLQYFCGSFPPGLSCLWSSLLGSPTFEMLLHRRPQLCSPMSIPGTFSLCICSGSLIHPPWIWTANAAPLLPQLFCPQQPASSHNTCDIQRSKADPFQWISFSQSKTKPLGKKNPKQNETNNILPPAKKRKQTKNLL